MAYDFKHKDKWYCIANKDDVDLWIEDIRTGCLDAKEYPVPLDKIKEALAKGEVVIEEVSVVPGDGGSTCTDIFLPFTAQELEERPDAEAYLRSWVF